MYRQTLAFVASNTFCVACLIYISVDIHRCLVIHWYSTLYAYSFKYNFFGTKFDYQHVQKILLLRFSRPWNKNLQLDFSSMKNVRFLVGVIYIVKNT